MKKLISLQKLSCFLKYNINVISRITCSHRPRGAPLLTTEDVADQELPSVPASVTGWRMPGRLRPVQQVDVGFRLRSCSHQCCSQQRSNTAVLCFRWDITSSLWTVHFSFSAFSWVRLDYLVFLCYLFISDQTWTPLVNSEIFISISWIIVKKQIALFYSMGLWQLWLLLI